MADRNAARVTRHLALLGSINVGGNRIAMGDLCAALTQRGFAQVASVAASGNILFDHVGDAAQMPDTPDTTIPDTFAPARAIAACLSEDFGIDSAVVVMNAAQCEAAIADNPFVADGADNLVHIHFLEDHPPLHAFDTLVDDHRGRGDERIALGHRALYIDYVTGVGRSKLTSAFIAKRMGCRGTARNIRSLRRIIAAMGG